MPPYKSYFQNLMQNKENTLKMLELPMDSIEKKKMIKTAKKILCHAFFQFVEEDS